MGGRGGGGVANNQLEKSSVIHVVVCSVVTGLLFMLIFSGH